MEVRKASESKSDLLSNSRSLLLVPLHSYVSIPYDFRYISRYFQNIQKSGVPEYTPSGV